MKKHRNKNKICSILIILNIILVLFCSINIDGYDKNIQTNLNDLKISDSLNLLELGQFDDGGGTRDVYVSGDIAYLVEDNEDGGNGFEIINIA